MNLTLRNPAPRRSAFTLIELLVVIAIIAILASLILAGVMMMFGKGEDVKNRNDILQLEGAMKNFQVKYHFYPPERLRLCSSRAQYASSPSPLDTLSISAINRMFPNINWVNIAWDGANTNLDVVLDCDQSIVFFLGGIPNGPNLPPAGFSNNPQNPALPTGDRISFMKFPGGRMKNLRGSPFPSFIDAYNMQPFIYFSSFAGGRTDGYDQTSGATFSVVNGPYRTGATNPKFHNASTYQIISAGRDGVFGPGGVWSSATAETIAQPGRDDMTNFHGNNMGVP